MPDSSEKAKQVALARSILEGYGYQVLPPDGSEGDRCAPRPTPAVDLQSAASSLALRYQEDRRVVCVGVRAGSIAVMINRTKRTRPEIPSIWQGWPVETVDHGPFAVVGGDPNA